MADRKADQNFKLIFLEQQQQQQKKLKPCIFSHVVYTNGTRTILSCAFIDVFFYTNLSTNFSLQGKLKKNKIFN